MRGEKVASTVARQIARDIVDFSLDPGAPLAPESAMLDRFGVSRASLREGLRILETQGLITIKPGPRGGASVARVDSASFGRMATLYFQVLQVRLREVVEARLIIEPVMAGLAAERRDPELEQDLRDSVAGDPEAMDEAEWLATSHRFHTVVLGMSGNPLLNLVATSLKDIFTTRISGLLFPTEERTKVQAVHRAIAEAIDRGDADAAERLMRDHMQEYAANVAARFPGLMDEIVDWR